MRIDITLPITEKMWMDAKALNQRELEGHLGTHFDTMDQEFPLDYTEREGMIYDVSHLKDREIGLLEVDLSKVKAGMFVLFYTGYIERVPYGEGGYFKDHPQLSMELIRALVEKGVSIIGLDFAGIRRTPEHIPTDQYCAERGTFIIENLWNLQALLGLEQPFLVHTYPLRSTAISGLPCRVIVETEV